MMIFGRRGACKHAPYAVIMAICMALLAGPIWAVEPDEMLDDPVLEQRARDLSRGLRCLVCRNESIDESHAELARDLRLLVRERLVAGDSDAAALEFIVNRYGEFVLLKPTTSGANMLLWIAGPAMLLLGAGISLIYLRRRSPQGAEDLTAAEQARLDEILKG